MTGNMILFLGLRIYSKFLYHLKYGLVRPGYKQRMRIIMYVALLRGQVKSLLGSCSLCKTGNARFGENDDAAPAFSTAESAEDSGRSEAEREEATFSEPSSEATAPSVVAAVAIVNRQDVHLRRTASVTDS